MRAKELIDRCIEEVANMECAAMENEQCVYFLRNGEPGCLIGRVFEETLRPFFEDNPDDNTDTANLLFAAEILPPLEGVSHKQTGEFYKAVQAAHDAAGFHHLQGKEFRDAVADELQRVAAMYGLND